MNSVGYKRYYCWFFTTRNIRLCLSSAVSQFIVPAGTMTAALQNARFFGWAVVVFYRLALHNAETFRPAPVLALLYSWHFVACCLSWGVTSSGGHFHPPPAPFTSRPLCVAFLPSIGKNLFLWLAAWCFFTLSDLLTLA